MLIFEDDGFLGPFNELTECQKPPLGGRAQIPDVLPPRFGILP